MARIARIGIGFALLIVGAFLLVLPGPGILTIVAGLALLSRDIPVAGRIMRWLKARFAGVAAK